MYNIKYVDTFFIDKVPSFLFDYFDRVVEKIKKAYSE